MTRRRTKAVPPRAMPSRKGTRQPQACSSAGSTREAMSAPTPEPSSVPRRCRRRCQASRAAAGRCAPQGTRWRWHTPRPPKGPGASGSPEAGRAPPARTWHRSAAGRWRRSRRSSALRRAGAPACVRNGPRYGRTAHPRSGASGRRRRRPRRPKRGTPPRRLPGRNCAPRSRQNSHRLRNRTNRGNCRSHRPVSAGNDRVARRAETPGSNPPQQAEHSPYRRHPTLSPPARFAPPKMRGILRGESQACKCDRRLRAHLTRGRGTPT